RVVAVVLSGGLDDGSYGVAMVRRQGGVTVAQDPNEAEVPQMPMNAIRTGRVDHVLPLRDIGPLIGKLVEEPVAAGASSRPTPGEPDVAPRGTDLQKNPPPGPPTPFRCPECGGALWETDQDPNRRFRCHVGHGYTAEGLMAKQDEQVEAALWTAVRELEER